MRRRSFTTGLAALAAAPLARGARADGLDRPLKLAIMNSMADTYSAAGGPGSVAACRMAIEDVRATVAGVPVELLTLDH